MIQSDKTSTVKPFLGEDFLLENRTAEILYHEYAKDQPIIDYHCHLPPDEIAQDRRFANLTKIWLDGDHYKWRAMRTIGVSEQFITGDAGDFEKFRKWAESVPFTIRNPLFHWTHLELKRYFGIDELLKPASAKAIYDQCSEQLQTPDFSTRNILRKMNVEVVCTTDDPTDDLKYHQQVKQDGFEIRVLPAFRPDKAILIEKEGFVAYIEKLVFDRVVGSAGKESGLFSYARLPPVRSWTGATVRQRFLRPHGGPGAEETAGRKDSDRRRSTGI